MDNTQYFNYKQRLAKLKSCEQRILSICPDIPNRSGIYFFHREEKGIHFGYVGQTKKLLSRCAEHLIGYQHIDNSLKTHGLYDQDKNPTGYKLWFKEFPYAELDKQEQFYIQYFANKGIQLRNKTVGSQGEGKTQFGDSKSTKGYRDGLKQGYENCRKEIIEMFAKYLDFSLKKTGKIGERKLEQFKEFLNPVGAERIERVEELQEREHNERKD